MKEYETRAESLAERHKQRLEQTAREKINTNCLEEAHRAADELIAFSEENLLLEGVAKGYYYQGVVYHLQNQRAKAIEYFKKALPVMKETADYSGYARSLKMMGIIYSSVGDDNQFMECYVKGLSCAKEYGILDLVSEFYNSIGSRYQVMGAHDLAVSYFQKALEVLKRWEGDKEKKARSEIVISLNCALSGAYEGKQEMAQQLMEQVQRIYKEKYHGYELAMVLTDGRINVLLGNREKAARKLPEILSLIRKNVALWDYEQYLRESMELFFDLEQFEMADEALRVFEGIARQEPNIYWKMQTTGYRIELLKHLGQEEKTGALYQDFFQYYKERQKEEKKWKTENMRLRIELNDAEHKQSEILTENRLLESRSEIDSLTGIFNRYCLEKNSMISEEIDGKTIGFGIIDIDYFKQLNDAYGHGKGDRCLVEVAQILLMAVGMSGKVYRYGGDEFIIILHEGDTEGICEIAEKVKCMMEEAEIPNRRSPVSTYITLSQGYAVSKACPKMTRTRLFQEADKALYYVKENGRNGYHICSMEEE